MVSSVLFLTASDAAYFPLVQGTIRSIREKPQGQTAALAFFDLGCSSEQLQWIAERVDHIHKPEWVWSFPSRKKAPNHLKGLLVRPFLPRHFPGYELYFWIDADAWVQDWTAVDLFLRGAAKRGAALVPELDRASRFQYGGLLGYWDWAAGYYEAAFGEEVAEKVATYPMLNAGVFAFHKDAPHWDEWARYLESGLQKSHSMIDQLALNVVVYGRGLLDKTELLPAWCNWTCHFGLPAWDPERQLLVEPYLPHTPIGILHLTRQKRYRERLATTAGDWAEVGLRYPATTEAGPDEPQLALAFPAGDYVAPGLASVRADPFFPHMIVGDRDTAPWPYLRRDVPHNWYVDRRRPSVGFLNRDEAHILYNTALQFQGKRALEIGGFFGWSTCHLALAGVLVDVVDPLLSQHNVRDSVRSSLEAAGVADLVNIMPGLSPHKVEELASQGRRWSLFLIDGSHDRPAPLEDAMICARYAEPDAAILFHDLVSPDVAEGLDYLRKQGWQTRLYQTMQIMGVAWRGNVEPLRHLPDPKVHWKLPEHLRGYDVSGWEGTPSR